MCPQCAWGQVERWLAKQTGRLLACEHYHVIFTMPYELHALWRANVEVMSRLLFVSVQDTVLELLGDAQDLGARPGIIATLHTWTQTLVLPPHVHCLATGGGLTADGHWRAVRDGFVWPVRVRGWGLYGHTQGAALVQCRQQVGQGPVEVPPPREGPHENEAWGQAPAERCPVCGQPLVCLALLPQAEIPPPTETGWEQVA
jgi:Putative transposase/Transposase zinc-binding domain